MIDIHSHIAWQIDDGMPSKEDAITSFQTAKEDGIEIICSTPHFVCGQYDQDSIQQIRNRQKECRELAKEYNIQIAFGAEVFMNQNFPGCLKEGLYETLNQSKYLLCEFDVRKDIHDIIDHDEYLYEITAHGMIPCIAHVERYFSKGLDMDIVSNWFEKGYVFQINRTSLYGIHGKTIQKNATSLMEQGYCHVIATDTHRSEGSRVEILSDIYSEIKKKYGEDYANLLFKTNPYRILTNQEVISRKPKKKGFFERR